jgi:carbonic anhydrase
MRWAPFGRTDEPPPAESEQEPAAPQELAAPETEQDRAAAALPRVPARRLAVVTCMDSRLDPLADLGLARGDAMVLRNAGATVSDDVERSLRLAHETLGVREAWLVAHSDCAAHGGADAAAVAELRRGAVRLRSALPGVSVRLLFCDFATGAAVPVEPPG